LNVKTVQKQTHTFLLNVHIKHKNTVLTTVRLGYAEIFTYVMMDNAPLFTRLRLLMLVILIEILTEIPLQKQHIMRQLNTHIKFNT